MSTASAGPSTAEQSAEIADSWYLAPSPRPASGWLVFSEAFALAALQGKRERPEEVRRSGGWLAIVWLLLGVAAVGQAVLMLLARVPLLGAWLQYFATFYPRGAAGFFLRACYWKARLRRLGRDTLIDRGVEIWGADNISVGAHCHLDTYVRLAAGEAALGQCGDIRIGNWTHLGPGCHIAGRGGVEIGDFVSLQAGVHVYSATNTMFDPRHPGQLISLSHIAPADRQHTHEAPVRIDDYVMIGYQSLLLPGAQIGRGALVHPFTQVARRFEPFANIMGPGPARQNGWRRPLRRDPRLEPAHPAGD